MGTQLRLRTVLAAAAATALCLSACSQGGGDSGSEASSEAPRASEDYTTEQIESTLAAATVGGQPLEQVRAMHDVEGSDMIEGAYASIQSELDEVEVEPAACHDAVKATMGGRLVEGTVEQSVAAVTDDAATVSAVPMDSAQAADQRVRHLREVYDGCQELSFDHEGQHMEVETTTEVVDVEGAGEAMWQKSIVTSDGEEMTMSYGSMSIGNVVIDVQDDDSGEPGAESDDDYPAVLADIAPTFVEGPVEPSAGPSDGAPADSSAEASDSAS